MATQNIEQVMHSADALSADELLEVAQRLIDRAREKSARPIDINALAGTLVLDEDPMAIQERMRDCLVPL